MPMNKKHYFITIDTETTDDNLVADFAAVITDRKGNIVAQCGILVAGIFTNPVEHPLFTDKAVEKNSIWHRNCLAKRYDNYDRMVKNGTRMIATVNAINRWLVSAYKQFNPILTAYNLPFDLDKCEKTNINVTIFDRSFCLWAAAYSQFALTKKYKTFILENHYFNSPTDLRNMTYKTNAEVMTRFLLVSPDHPDEPHTALEDILFYELIILNEILKRNSVKDLLGNLKSYDWRKVQVKHHFKPN